MNPDRRKFWPCYGRQGTPNDFAYVAEDEGARPADAIPTCTNPVRLLQAMLMATRYQWEQDAQRRVENE